MTCEEWAARYLAGEVTPQAGAHLRGCASCRRARPQLDEVRSRLGDPAIWETPGAELGVRVVEVVRAGAAAAAAPRPARPRHPRRTRWWAGAAAAVLLAVAATAAALAWARPGGPDWRLDLEPTAAAPGASAAVSGWNSATGTRMELDVEGLAPSGDSAYYALWLTAPDGRHVPAATFRGSGMVIAWAGVSRDAFPRLWVTLEPADEDEALSGPTVLDTPGA